VGDWGPDDSGPMILVPSISPITGEHNNAQGKRGLSRKLSKDYNSEGFSINLEGEVSAPVNDPQGVVEQVKELYDLAEEALAQQIERAKSTEAIAFSG